MSGLEVANGQLDLWLLRQPWTDFPKFPLVISELDQQERKRADDFHRAHDRLLYLTAHIALRRIVAGYLGTSPENVRFTRAPCPQCGKPHGRPVLATKPESLHYSLSHSHGLALFGVATQPVGVDVEKLPSLETVDLCLPALHPAEQEELRAAPLPTKRMAFGRLWTRKEAYLKGIGTGLRRDPGKDYLGESTGIAPASPPGWTVRNVPCRSSHVDHVAAAAVRGEATPVVSVRWLPADCLYSTYTPNLFTESSSQYSLV